MVGHTGQYEPAVKAVEATGKNTYNSILHSITHIIQCAEIFMIKVEKFCVQFLEVCILGGEGGIKSKNFAV